MSFLRSKHKESCQCCASVDMRWTYLNGSIRYCATCLHSVGVTTQGTPCSQAACDRAWHELVHGKPSKGQQ